MKLIFVIIFIFYDEFDLKRSPESHHLFILSLEGLLSPTNIQKFLGILQDKYLYVATQLHLNILYFT